MLDILKCRTVYFYKIVAFKDKYHTQDINSIVFHIYRKHERLKLDSLAHPGNDYIAELYLTP